MYGLELALGAFADGPGVVFGQFSSGRSFGRSLAGWGLLGGRIGLLVKFPIFSDPSDVIWVWSSEFLIFPDLI